MYTSGGVSVIDSSVYSTPIQEEIHPKDQLLEPQFDSKYVPKQQQPVQQPVQQPTLSYKDYPYITDTLARLDDKNISPMNRYTLYTKLVDFVWLIGPTKEFRDEVFSAIDKTDVMVNRKTYFTLAG